MPHNNFIDRIWNKVPHTPLTLGSSTTRHLVPRMHCILDACQRSAHMASHVGMSYA